VETAKGKTGEESITRLADRIDSFKHYSSPHSKLMVKLATHLASRFGLAQADIHAVAEAAYLHDIGLHAMMPAYQLTPGPLSFEERMDLWRHPIIGEQQMAKRDCLRHSQLLVRWHHEWWNGGGYPDQLAFEDIPIGARILRAVELYSALIADRPYRAALGHDQAIDTLKASAGIECDPYVVKALAALIEDINAQAKQSEPSLAGKPLVTNLTGNVAASTVERDSTANESSRAVERSAVEHSAIERSAIVPGDQAAFPPSDFPAVEPTVSEQPSEGQSSEAQAQEATEQQSRNEESQNQRLQNQESRNQESQNQPAAESTGPQLAALESDRSAMRTDAAIHIDNSSDNLSQMKEPDRVAASTYAPAPQSNRLSDAARQEAPAADALKLNARLDSFRDDSARIWSEWGISRYNKKTLLGFEASVLRQIEFRSIAIPFCGWGRLDLYLKMWGKHILANDSRAWAGAVARATVEAKIPLSEDQVARALEDVYVPGAKLNNSGLRRWFSETDAWWMDNLRRNIEALDDESLRAQAITIGLMTGDYALSFNDETRELRRPLTTVFWRLAGRAFLGAAGHPHNRSYNLPPDEFIKHARADLLYLNLPAVNAAQSGAEARGEWRESWVRGSAGADAAEHAAPQSKSSYLASTEKLLRAASNIKVWAIEYQEIGLATASELIELIKAHRPVRATYSKDLTEVVGGLRNYIIVAEKSSAN
jgi:HD domain-containing protein